MRVCCDFDGTVSVQDATDLVLSRLADPEWQAVEGLWQDGEIGSGECMRRQISMIRATPEQLDQVLDEVEIDPFFASFADFCAAHGVPLTIVSDGVDYFIKRILRRRGLDRLPVIANRLVMSDQGGKAYYGLRFLFADRTCKMTSGVCKCSWLAALGQERTYVGNGRSDFCVADKPEMVFAKGELAQHCAERNIPFFAYHDFSDVIAGLEDAVPLFRSKAADMPRYATAEDRKRASS